MDLIGQPIKHKIFGPGVVTDLTEKTVTICFQSSERKFVYPDAFADFLVLKDLKTQQRIEKRLKEREIAVQKARRVEQAEHERRRKLYNYKITINSHAVFNIEPSQVDQIVKMNKVSTGTYLSGNSKGQPRVADRMKPNSVCLLTTRPYGQPENGRIILGAFMVKEDFFGEEACDGTVEGHPQHRVLIPEESRLLFWQYIKNAQPRWGNTAFKYCSGDVINQILTDMVTLFASSEQEKTAVDFYKYFCKTNNLRPPIVFEEDGPEAK